MLLIQQANILIKDNDAQAMDVLIDDGKIIDVSHHIEGKNEYEVIVAKGLYLFSGLIDIHVHLREPGYEHKETIASGTRAAAHGGFTTIMAMPNIIPYPDHVEVMKTYLQKIESDAMVNVIPYACITKGEQGKHLSDIEGLSKLGIHAYSDDGIGVHKDAIMKEAMKVCKEQNAMIVAHTEDMKYRAPKACMHEGIRNKEMNLIGIPSACEYEQLHRDLNLAQEVGCAYHVCHMSAQESVQLLREYKAKGVNCSGEVTAHHLLLNEMDVQDSNYKMNPPLRSKKDQEALIQGLLDGSIDMIASDHAPHSEEEKSRGMELSPFGIVSLETAFPLLYTRFVKERKVCTLSQLIYWMSEAPAKRFQMINKGKIKKGYDADIILVDLEHEFTIDKTKFFSKGKNTPFHEWKCYGTIEKTFVSGKLIYNKEEHV